MSDKVGRAADTAERAIDRMAAGTEDATRAAADSAKEAVDCAADCARRAVRRVQERPFLSLGIAAVCGFILGLCARR